MLACLREKFEIFGAILVNELDMAVIVVDGKLTTF